MADTIGDVLVERKIITAQQLVQAQEAIAKTGQSLSTYLVENQQVNLVQVAQAMATLAQMDYVDSVSEQMADVDILAKIPLHFLRDNAVMPVLINGTLTILTDNPINFQPLDDVNRLLQGDGHYAVATQSTIIDALNRFYPLEGAKQAIEELGKEEEMLGEVDLRAVDEKDIGAMATEAPIIKLVNTILLQAIKRGASDIHIEPFEKEIRVRYRIDGVLYDVMMPPKRIQGALASRIKIMAHLDIAEKRIPQDGRIDVKITGKPYDIRVSVLPVAFGERVVMRILDKSRTFGKLQNLGFGDRDFQLITDSIARPNGIIYVTGPTGSGKTSTLYCILGELNKPDVNIITVEDPVEYQMAGVGQVQVKEKVGMTFAAALRSILRQDPDVVMIGETRDQETAQIAIQAALTGHLVLSTLHTNSAPATITRLLDMGVEPFLIASSIVVVIAQRLVRQLCTACKKTYQPPVALLRNIGLAAEGAESIVFYQAQGCEECNQTGYKGRIAIFELMSMTPDIARLTMARADTSLLRKQAIADGMIVLINDGLRKIKAGLTTLEEVLSVAAIEHESVE
jgi:type II secretion system protein E